MNRQVRRFALDITQRSRALLRSPGYLAATITTLALAVAAGSTVFAVFDTVVLNPLPFADPGRLVMVWEDLARTNNHRFSVSEPNFEEVRQSRALFSDAAAQVGIGMNVKIDGTPELMRGAQVSDNYFRLLGWRTAAGRFFDAADSARGAANLAVVSWRFAERRLGGVERAVGRSISLDGTSYTVVGVAGERFVAPAFFKAAHQLADVWTPLRLTAQWQVRDAALLQVVARLDQNVSAADAQRGLNTVAATLARRFPDSNAGVGFAVVSMSDQVLGPLKPLLGGALAAALLLVVIAGVNVASLTLVRTMTRLPEMSVRAALGATRWDLAREACAENLVVVFAGGVIGLGLAFGALAFLVRIAPITTVRLADVHLNATVITAALAICMATAIAFGGAAARFAARAIDRTARAEGRTTAARQVHVVRRAMTVVQIAIAIMLASGAALMTRTLLNLARVDPGFSAEHLLSMRFGMVTTKYRDGPSCLLYLRRLLTAIESVPGEDRAGFSSRLPLDPAFGVAAIRIPERSYRPGQEPRVGARLVDEGYFGAMQIPLLDGRVFTAADSVGAAPVVMVNRAFARQFWGTDRVAGRRVNVGGDSAWAEVVGVVGDVSHDGLASEPIAELYLAYAQDPASGGALVARTRDAPERAERAIREAVLHVDPDQALIDVRTMHDAVVASVANQRVSAAALLGFGGLAILLTGIGLYGVLTHDVRARSRELAIRAALGAELSKLATEVVRSGMVLVAAGVGIGVAASLAGARLLEAQLYGVKPDDAKTLFIATSIVALTAIAALLLPAARARRVDLMLLLRDAY